MGEGAGDKKGLKVTPLTGSWNDGGKTSMSIGAIIPGSRNGVTGYSMRNFF
jgi:hypothetical protein